MIHGPIPFEGTAVLEPREGGTQYTFSASVEAGGFLKLAEALIKKQLYRQHEANLNALKTVLEEEQSG